VKCQAVDWKDGYSSAKGVCANNAKPAAEFMYRNNPEKKEYITEEVYDEWLEKIEIMETTATTGLTTTQFQINRRRY
jgi:hypothetical protein